MMEGMRYPIGWKPYNAAPGDGGGGSGYVPGEGGGNTPAKGGSGINGRKPIKDD